jgi:hypothetical protein
MVPKGELYTKTDWSVVTLTTTRTIFEGPSRVWNLEQTIILVTAVRNIDELCEVKWRS